MFIQAEIQKVKSDRLTFNRVQMTVEVRPVNSEDVLTIIVTDSIDEIIRKFNACPINGKLITGHLKNMFCLIEFREGVYSFVKLQQGNMTRRSA